MSTAPRACPPRSDACPASPRPRRQHGPFHHVLTQVCVPGVIHHGWSPGCSDPLVKTQHSPFTAPGPSAQAHMTFTSAIDHRSCAPHLHTTSRPTWLHKHNLTLWSVHWLPQSATRWQSLFVNPNHKGQINLVFAHAYFSLQVVYIFGYPLSSEARLFCTVLRRRLTCNGMATVGVRAYTTLLIKEFLRGF
jgi:hypothetical protein